MVTMAGNFSSLPLMEVEKEIYDDMYKTITSLGLWDWLSQPDVAGYDGFMFSENPELYQIRDNLTYREHSETSFIYAIHVMHNIAVDGWDAYVTKLRKTPTCPCMRKKGVVGWCGVAGGGVPACDH